MIKKYLEQSLGNEATSKDSWRIAKNLMGVKQHKTPEKLIVNDLLINDPKIIADKLNKYFTEKVETIKKNHQ